MQFPGQGKPATGIVFDTTMGRSIDEALALALLYGFDGKNEARLVSVSISNPDLKAAAFCDAVSRFYAGATKPEVRAFSHGLPIGLATDRKIPSEDTPMLSVPLSKVTFGNEIKGLNDTADPAPLIRNAFTAQYDQNSLAIVTGPATNMVRALELPGVKELIAKKARLLCFVTSEFNIKTDIASAKKLLAEWPVPVVTVGPEIGEALLFPGASIDKDFAWATRHPVVDAYRAYKPMPYDAPTCDMAAVLYAVRPKEGYFKLSDPGVISITDDGRTKFAAAPDGKHQYLILDPAQKERIVKTYVEIASAKPVPRQPRFKPDKKKEEPKAPDAKPVDVNPPAVKPPDASTPDVKPAGAKPPAPVE